MKTLTVFTPSFNRKHTIIRTFESLCRQSSFDFNWLIIDDGSSDGTREWVESLGTKTMTEGVRFDWMGRLVDGQDENHFILDTDENRYGKSIRIEYVFKQNGGLYTGYNVAYSVINTELCVCIDSDDYMPDDAVENICNIWQKSTARENSSSIGGMVGLDYNVVDKKPIGGYFAEENVCNYLEISHPGDCKHVLRTDLMKKVCPQEGFERERDFNPYYMIMQVCDRYPLLVTNTNFCWVEYQTTGDSMSAAIWKQYVRSPRSYAKYRIMQLKMNHGNSWKNKIRLSIHYVSSCILAKDNNWLRNSPNKLLTLLFAPMGLLFLGFVKYKNRH